MEINSTFYRLPTEAAVAGWVEQTPNSFRFSVKASRYITHIKRLNNPEKYVERFLDSVKPLTEARKLEAILWQLPPSFKRNDERLDAALTAIRDRAPGRHVVELRHPSWFTKDVYELLGSHKAALAIVDDPKYPFAERQLTTAWTYVRMHRGGRGSGGYTKAELTTWKRRVAAWRRKADVYVYFNNTTQSFAVEDARTMRGGLS